MNTSTLPVILSRPHGGLSVPCEIEEKLAIDEIALYNECDLWIDKLFDFSHSDIADDLSHILPEGTDYDALASVSMPIARGLIDVNRPLRMLGAPDGPIKARTSYGEQIYHEPLAETTTQQLVDRYWRNYHANIRAAMQEHHGNVKLFIDCHNMAQFGPTKYRDAGQPRPLICITNLGDADGNPRPEHGWTFAPTDFAQKAVQAAWDLFEDMELLEPDAEAPPPPVALLNQPFWGSYVIVEHCSPVKIQAEYIEKDVSPPMCIMIEVNRGLYVGNRSRATEIAPPNEARIREIRSRLYLWTLRLLDLLED